MKALNPVTELRQSQRMVRMLKRTLKMEERDNKAWEGQHATLFAQFVEQGKAKQAAELKLRIATRALESMRFWRYDQLIPTQIADRRALVTDTLLVLRAVLPEEEK